MSTHAATEAEQRRHLAACYRLIAHLGVEDLTYNHVSARVPGEDAFLVKPMDQLFREVTASGLEKYRMDGAGTTSGEPRAHNALLVLHASVLAARPDVACVIHTHSVANVAVSALACGLLPMSQHALTLRGEIGYHDFGGYEFDLDTRESVVRDLGANAVLVLRNHGVLVVGRSVAEACIRHHFYEMACRSQVAALSSGAQVGCPPLPVQERAHAQIAQAQLGDAGAKDWPACLRLADALDPGYRD